MARGKARFLGSGAGQLVDWRFSGTVREKIKKLYPAKHTKSEEERDRMALAKKRQEETGEVPTHPAEMFVDDIEHEAKWALFEIIASDKEGHKKDVLAELTDLLKKSQSLKDRFRRLSPDVNRLFSGAMEPLEHADYLNAVCEDLEKVITRSGKLPQKERISAVKRKIAVELAIRVLRVAKQYKMDISATADPSPGYEYYSDTVKLLSYVGMAVQLEMKETWWKTIIIEARKKAPDLKL